MGNVAHDLIRAVFEPNADRLNLSALARAVGISPQRMHGYWTGRFPWPADVMLRVIAASGRLRMWGDRIEIKAEIPSDVLALKEIDTDYKIKGQKRQRSTQA